MPRNLLRLLDKLVRSNIYLYFLVRRIAVFLCRYVLLEDGFSFLRNVKPLGDSLALDVGSNDGTSIEMILQTVPKAQIISFDPVRSPRTLKSQVTFKNVALSDVTGDLILHSPWYGKRHLSQYSSSDRQKVVSQLCDEFDLQKSEIRLEEIRSPAIKLDSLELTPFLIKIDVEGHELKVLAGSESTLKRALPIVLVEIQDEFSYREISIFLEDRGYFNLSWPQPGEKPDFSLRGDYKKSQNNYLFLPISPSSTWEPQ